MHIADGILRPEVATAANVAALAAVSMAANQLRSVEVSRARTVATAGVAAAVLFAVSSTPLPAWPGTSAHALGTAMVALVGGVPLTMLATALVVFLQALAGHGGLTAWGADAITMGLLGPLAAVTAYRLLTARGTVSVFWATTAAAFAACAATYVSTAAVIAYSMASSPSAFPSAFFAVIAAYLPAEAPMIAIESLATGFLAARMMRSDMAGRLAGLSPLLGGRQSA